MGMKGREPQGGADTRLVGELRAAVHGRNISMGARAGRKRLAGWRRCKGCPVETAEFVFRKSLRGAWEIGFNWR